MMTILGQSLKRCCGIPLLIALLTLSCAGTKPSCRFETSEFSNLKPRRCADSLGIREEFPYLQRIHESAPSWTAPLYLYYKGEKLAILDTIPETYDIVRRQRRVSKFPYIMPWATYPTKDGFHVYLRETERIIVYVAKHSGEMLFVLNFGKLEKGTSFYFDPEILLRRGASQQKYSFNLVCDRQLCARVAFSLVHNH